MSEEIEYIDINIIVALDREDDTMVVTADECWDPNNDWPFAPVTTHRITVRIPRPKFPVAVVTFPENSQEPAKVEIA